MPSPVLQAVDRWDHRAARWIDGHRWRPLTVLAVVVTYSGSGVVWGVSATALAVLCKLGIEVLPRQETFLACMLASGLSLITGSVIKVASERKRPSQAIEGLRPAIRVPFDASFPSTHTSTCIALLVGLALVHHPLAWALAPWCLAVPLTRIYLGVHYPTDVLGGAALGALFGLTDYTGLVADLLRLG